MQPFETFFDITYVLSLQRSFERKKHMTHFFEKNNIEFYKFFEGTDFTEPIIQEIKLQNLINTQNQKNCIRCDKYICNCQLPKKNLFDTEIANWISFIRIFEEIKTKKIKKALILEDDIVFNKNGLSILNNVFTPDFYQKYNINPNKPVLIRIGSGYNKKYHEPNTNNTIVLDNEMRMSNPAFFVNDKFVELFLNTYSPISFTSDMFIHKKIIELNPEANIQHFSILPSPIYELSWGKTKKFKSLIRDN